MFANVTGDHLATSAVDSVATGSVPEIETALPGNLIFGVVEGALIGTGELIHPVDELLEVPSRWSRHPAILLSVYLL
jgi:hypothetical protein